MASLFPQAVKRFLKLECKCHGVSGSCTLRTCWLAMSDFRKTGDYLRKKYNGAIQVTMNQDGTGFTVANKNFRKPTKTDLVYFENSPDYCVMDKSAGKNQSSSCCPKAALLPLLTGQQLPPGPAWPGCSGTSAPTKAQCPVGGSHRGRSPGPSAAVGAHWVPAAPHACADRTGFVQNPRALHQRSKPIRPLIMDIAQRFLRAFPLQSRAPLNRH